jgi:glycine betaine/choline ABC-type transport system substrate-binding protein
MKIKIEKELKIRLLKAIQSGEIDLKEFPEFTGSQCDFFKLLTDQVDEN